MGDDILYKSPAFQFYADDFTADTADLTAEEVGVYMRLLCHQWKQGGIPRDCARQALIGHVSAQKMRSIWGHLSDKYTYHPSNDSLFIQPRLERVRQEAAEHRARRAEAGAKGGRSSTKRTIEVAQEATTDLSNALAMLEQSDSNGGSIEQAKRKQNESSPVSTIDPTTSVDKSTSVVGISTPRKKRSKEVDTSWVQPLRDSAKAIAARQIRQLSEDERDTLSRYHCLEFGNCTQSQSHNKARAVQVAAAFASMSRNETYGALTVRGYVNYARKVHAKRDNTPWFEPWLIRAVVEFE